MLLAATQVVQVIEVMAEPVQVDSTQEEPNLAVATLVDSTKVEAANSTADSMRVETANLAAASPNYFPRKGENFATPQIFLLDQKKNFLEMAVFLQASNSKMAKMAFAILNSPMTAIDPLLLEKFHLIEPSLSPSFVVFSPE